MSCNIDDGINVRLEIAVPLGLLVNELISNTCRYVSSAGNAER